MLRLNFLFHENLDDFRGTGGEFPFQDFPGGSVDGNKISFPQGVPVHCREDVS